WLRRPSKVRFVQGAVFTLGVTIVAFGHGGMMSSGPEYGSGVLLKLRDGLGYISGSLLDHMNWLLAGFGLPLVLAMVSILIWWRYPKDVLSQRTRFLAFFGIFGLVSFMIPQLFYFSHGSGVEEETQIAKFFFCTHLSIAVVSVIAMDWFSKRLGWWVFLPSLAVIATMTAITPLAVSIVAAHEHDANRRWLGFYRSPYDWQNSQGGKDYIAVGKALRRLKKGNRDVYYDFSMAERGERFLSELLIYGGSVFSMSPTKYEVAGAGFLISEEEVKERIRLESRIARLLPGAAEESETNWILMPSIHDSITRPTIVRSRLAKMIASGILSKKFQSGSRMLYEFEGMTHDLDQKIERYWAPKVISQAHADWDGDGNSDLIFFNYLDNSIHIEKERIALPNSGENEFPLIFLAKLPGDDRADLIMGHMSDGFYRRSETVSKMVRQYPFHWQRRDSMRNNWLSTYQHLFWGSPIDIAFVADHDNDGYDSQLGYRPSTGEWFEYPGKKIKGPSLPNGEHPLPVVGRFLPGSQGDLAVWSPVTGRFTVKSVQDSKSASINWGGRSGDIILPGDYDGDGYDEVGLWQPHTRTWWVRSMLQGTNRQFKFGTSSGIPIPHDYNDDGRLDLAYWEPFERKIYVSFDFGRSVGRTIEVPAYSLPIFVHMY
ncbi:MAG: VCBS repeat-containing protein, partial [Gammaproteobacteria bacterium]|nr:VCBS repeat-containing protein [Gammaproteobacteria bacterium]NNJ84291.1 VCBS repeat-containing protein [Gammaproteobacteria bacterium]